MKLAILISLLLAVPAVARAETIDPPSGTVHVDDEARARQPDPQRPRKAKQLRRALMEQFDVNGDGRLGPRERMRALRMLRKLEQRLATGGGAQRQRGPKMRRFIERHDRNGDGTVGPREVPRRAAEKFRRFDRDGDGWVDEHELDQ
jgi:Ca2+-binding EF-hand superfamily protein